MSDKQATIIYKHVSAICTTQKKEIKKIRKMKAPPSRNLIANHNRVEQRLQLLQNHTHII